MAEVTLAQAILKAIADDDPEALSEVDYAAAKRAVALRWGGYIDFRPDLTGECALQPEAYGPDGKQIGEADDGEWVRLPFTFDDVLKALHDHDNRDGALRGALAKMRAAIDALESQLDQRA